jgi:hypothetical protein
MIQGPQITSSSQPSLHDRLFPKLFWLSCVILVIAYVLSFGPAIYVLPISATRFLYGPLVQFEQFCPPLHRFQSWYMETVWNCKM